MSEISGTDFPEFLQNRFGTGKRFTEDYIQYFEGSQNLKLRSIADWENLESTRRMWFDFAMSTNQRGNDLMAFLGERMALKDRRYLDVGCGFGGFLVAAAQRGARCAGIEIDPLRLDFTRANTTDFGIHAQLELLDALSPDLAARLSRFDIISVNDVAEHVESAENLLRNLAGVLNPGGILYVEIPNGDSMRFIASDGHYGLFGITLLNRLDAIRYHWENFHWQYEVGDYHPLEQCFEFFRRAGLRAELISSRGQSTAEMTELPQLIAQAEEARSRFVTPLPDIRAKVEAAYVNYRRRLEQDRASLSETDFRNRYLRDFWTFLATPK